MAIIDSSEERFDDFRWSVYNIAGDRLLSLAFNNENLAISYGLDDEAGLIWTGHLFTNEVVMDLAMTLDFAENQWSATVGGTMVTTNLPITTSGSPLTLGDIDAVWVHLPEGGGDNWMVFDNYLVTAEPVGTPPEPPELASLGLGDGSFLLRVTGEAGRDYAIDASTNLTDWLPLRTNTANGGTFDFVDTGAGEIPNRFYRARWIP
jgi:hypothetical protein